eukprot:436484-Hanusia_phi.AAC.1
MAPAAPLRPDPPAGRGSGGGATEAGIRPAGLPGTRHPAADRTPRSDTVVLETPGPAASGK